MRKWDMIWLILSFTITTYHLICLTINHLIIRLIYLIISSQPKVGITFPSLNNSKMTWHEANKSKKLIRDGRLWDRWDDEMVSCETDKMVDCETDMKKREIIDHKRKKKSSQYLPPSTISSHQPSTTISSLPEFWLYKENEMMIDFERGNNQVPFLNISNMREDERWWKMVDGEMVKDGRWWEMRWWKIYDHINHLSSQSTISSYQPSHNLPSTISSHLTIINHLILSTISSHLISSHLISSQNLVDISHHQNYHISPQ